MVKADADDYFIFELLLALWSLFAEFYYFVIFTAYGVCEDTFPDKLPPLIFDC